MNLIVFFALFLSFKDAFCLDNSSTWNDTQLYISENKTEQLSICLGELYDNDFNGMPIKDYRIYWMKENGIAFPFEGGQYDAYMYNDNHNPVRSRAINIGFWGIDPFPKDDFYPLIKKFYRDPVSFNFIDFKNVDIITISDMIKQWVQN